MVTFPNEWIVFTSAGREGVRRIAMISRWHKPFVIAHYCTSQMAWHMWQCDAIKQQHSKLRVWGRIRSSLQQILLPDHCGSKNLDSPHQMTLPIHGNFMLCLDLGLGKKLVQISLLVSASVWNNRVSPGVKCFCLTSKHQRSDEPRAIDCQTSNLEKSGSAAGHLCSSSAI